MTAMDHAAAHERIEDLLLEPTRLAALPRSTDAADAALREHVAGCPVCRADLEAWQQLQDRLTVALPASSHDAAAAVEPIVLPPSLREDVIAAVREEARVADIPPSRRDREASSGTVPISIAGARPRRALAGWLALAASIVLVVGLGAVSIDQVSQRTTAEANARALSSALAAVDRVLTAPDHWVVPLTDSAGTKAGSISWSSQDLVVLTTALAAPPAGQRYRCWLVDGETSTAIGSMYFAGRTAYWVGSLDEWATFRIGPNTRFAVTLQQADATAFTGPVYLSADLGG